MHDADQGSPYDVTAEIGQISDEVAPIAREPVIVKNCPSSFFQSDLGAQFEKVGRPDLVLTGLMTHMCVNSTRGTPSTSATGQRSWPARPPPANCPCPAAQPCPQFAAGPPTLAGIADLFAVVAGTPDDIPG